MYRIAKMVKVDKMTRKIFVAANISDNKRQRALLLHYAREEVSEIFDTLTNTGDDTKRRRKNFVNTLTRRKMWTMKPTYFDKLSRTLVSQ